MPGMPPAQPPKKKRGGLIALIIVLVVALLGGGGGAGYWYFMLRDDPSKPVVAGQARAPQAAVRGFLQALAAGNASDALSFVSQSPSEMTFLTDAALAASSNYQITSIVATKDDASTKQNGLVDATFNIGSTPYTVQYQVDLVGKYYFIENAFAHLNLSDLYVSGLDMTMNGIYLSQFNNLTDVPAFPGVYTVAIASNPLLTITSDTSFTVISGDHSTPTVDIELAAGAQDKFAAAADEKLKSCMAENTTLTTCGFGWIMLTYNGQPLTPKSNGIKWSFPSTKPNFSKETFMWRQSDPTTVTAYISVKVHVELTATDGYTYYKDSTLSAVHIDFSNPDDMKVTFDD